MHFSVLQLCTIHIARRKSVACMRTHKSGSANAGPGMGEGSTRRGRPRGTHKPQEQKRQLVTARLSPEVHLLLEEGLAASPPSLSKTEFIEQAIRRHAQEVVGAERGLLDGAAFPALATEPGEETLDQKTEGGQKKRVEGREVGHLQPQMAAGQAGRDYIDLLLEDWAQEHPTANLLFFSVFMRLQRITYFLEKESARRLAPFGIAMNDFLLLAALRRSGPPYSLTPKALFHSLLIAPGTITKYIDRLEALHLVQRNEDEQDRRSVHVSLTARGHRAVEIITNSNADEHGLPNPQLSEEEYQFLTYLLRKILQQL